MTKIERIKMMSVNCFFKDFEENEISQLADLKDHFRRFKEGDFIVRQGEVSSSFYIILKGIIGIGKNWDNNIEIVTLKLGSAFGTVSLASISPRSTNAFAKNDVIVFMVDKPMLNSLDSQMVGKFNRMRKKVLVNRLEKLNVDIAQVRAEIQLFILEEGDEEGELDFKWPVD